MKTTIVICALAAGALASTPTAQSKDAWVERGREAVETVGDELVTDVVEQLKGCELLEREDLPAALWMESFGPGSELAFDMFREAAIRRLGVTFVVAESERDDYIERFYQDAGDPFVQVAYEDAIKKFGGTERFKDEKALIRVRLERSQVAGVDSLQLVRLTARIEDLAEMRTEAAAASARVHVDERVWHLAQRYAAAGDADSLEGLLAQVGTHDDLSARAARMVQLYTRKAAGSSTGFEEQTIQEVGRELAADLADALAGHGAAAAFRENDQTIATWLVDTEGQRDKALDLVTSAIVNRVGVTVAPPSDLLDDVLEKYWHRSEFDRAVYEQDQKQFDFKDERGLLRVKVQPEPIDDSRMRLRFNAELLNLPEFRTVWTGNVDRVHVSESFWSQADQFVRDEDQDGLRRHLAAITREANLSKAAQLGLAHFNGMLAEWNAERLAEEAELRAAMEELALQQSSDLRTFWYVGGGVLALIILAWLISFFRDPAARARIQAAEGDALMSDLGDKLEQDRRTNEKVQREISAAIDKLRGASKKSDGEARQTIDELIRELEQSYSKSRKVPEGNALKKGRWSADDSRRLGGDLLSHTQATMELCDELSGQVRDLVSAVDRGQDLPGDVVAMVRNVNGRLSERFRRRQDVIDEIKRR